MALTADQSQSLIEKVLEKYPEKARKNRAKHVKPNQADCDSGSCGVKSNIKSLPGVMTARGCAYAGSKGVVWGPIKDMIHISHGPVGCGHYSWSTRRNLASGVPGVENFVPFHFTSDFQERDIVYGGDKKLAKLLEEVDMLFPLNKGISVQSECPIGLIGDDIEAVSKGKEQVQLIEILKPVATAEQNAGIKDLVMPRLEKTMKKPEMEELLKAGDAAVNDAVWANSNIKDLHKVYGEEKIAETMKEIRSVIPVRCEGFRGVSQSLGHHIANDAIRDHLLGKKDLKEKTDYDIALIGDYNIGGDAWATVEMLEEIGYRVVSKWSGDGDHDSMAMTKDVKLNVIHCYRSMNYISRHMEEKYGIPWMEVNFFGPTRIKDSLRKMAERFDDKIKAKTEEVIAKHEKEMEETLAKYKPGLTGKQVMLYVGGLRPRHTIGAYEDLGMEIIGTGYEFGHNDDYRRTYPEMKDGTVIYDDVTAYEFEEFVKAMKPDLVASGIKEKYVFQKMGLPFRQMHSWDYSGPYHGWSGFKIFARDMDMALNSPTWDLIKPEWKK